jgi:hypothetical protein
VAPSGNDVAIFSFGHFPGCGIREKLGRRFQKSPIGFIPWIFLPVGIDRAAVLAMVLKRDLKPKPVLFR